MTLRDRPPPTSPPPTPPPLLTCLSPLSLPVSLSPTRLPLPHPSLSLSQDKEAVARRQRKAKEYLQDESFDHSPMRSWFRYDIHGSLRALQAATTADRLLVGPI